MVGGTRGGRLRERRGVEHASPDRLALSHLLLPLTGGGGAELSCGVGQGTTSMSSTDELDAERSTSTASGAPADASRGADRRAGMISVRAGGAARVDPAADGGAFEGRRDGWDTLACAAWRAVGGARDDIGVGASSLRESPRAEARPWEDDATESARIRLLSLRKIFPMVLRREWHIRATCRYASGPSHPRAS